MKQILVLGAGKIGALISGLLAESGDYEVQLADSVDGAANEVVEAHGLSNLSGITLDAADKKSLTAHVKSRSRLLSVISSLRIKAWNAIGTWRDHPGATQKSDGKQPAT